MYKNTCFKHQPIILGVGMCTHSERLIAVTATWVPGSSLPHAAGPMHTEWHHLGKYLDFLNDFSEVLELTSPVLNCTHIGNSAI